MNIKGEKKITDEGCELAIQHQQNRHWRSCQVNVKAAIPSATGTSSSAETQKGLKPIPKEQRLEHVYKRKGSFNEMHLVPDKVPYPV